MENKSGNYFGSSIDTTEITAGAVTLDKLDTTGALAKVLTAQGSGNAPIWDTVPNVPVGGVLAWLKTYTNTPALPSGYVECNGQTLSDAGSVYNGQVIPNLNGNNYFLEGNSTSGGTGGGSTHNHTPTNEAAGYNSGGSNYPLDSIASANNLPPYYNVVWVLRVK